MRIRSSILVLFACTAFSSVASSQAPGGEWLLHFEQEGQSDLHPLMTGAVVGDLDQDGVEELAIASRTATARGVLAAGLVRVLSGRTGRLLRQFEGQIPYEGFGSSVAGAGDADGDGVPDLLVSSVSADPFVPLGVAVSLYSGRTGRLLHYIPSPVQGYAYIAALAGLGDVDGDGRDDFGFGIPAARQSPVSLPGAVFVYSGATGSLLLRVDGRSDGGAFGSSLSAAGDRDGDGRADFLAGAPRDGNNGLAAESGYAWLCSGVSGSVLLEVQGLARDEQMGAAVAGGRDLDGDGTADLLFGAPGKSRVALFSGSSLQPVHEFAGSSNSRLGGALALIPDANGDGVAELLAGSAGLGSAFLYAGRSYALLQTYFLPSASTWLAGSDFDGDGAGDPVLGGPWSTATGDGAGAYLVYSGTSLQLLHEGTGFWQFDRFGQALAMVGDLDGDGLGDVAVGAPYASPGGRLRAGAVRLLSGKDGKLLRELQGAAALDAFGSAVSAVADVDGDGLMELLVGVPFAEASTQYPGAVTLYSLGRGVALWTICGQQHLEVFGAAVAGAGDVDGDGADDVLIGAPLRSAMPGGISGPEGAAELRSGATGALLHAFAGTDPYGHFGSAVSAAGDADGDAVPDLLIGAPDAGRGYAVIFSGHNFGLLHRLDALVLDEQQGYALAALGDVDGDGCSDVLVGAPFGSHGIGAHSGAARVYSGRSGSVLHEVLGEHLYDYLGRAVAGLGDVNDDGLPDWAAGAPYHDRPDATGTIFKAGAVYVYSGADGALLHRREGEHRDQQLGETLAGGSDLNGDGLNDVLVGAPNDQRQAGVVSILSLDAFLCPSQHSVSAANGGEVRLQIDFPPSEAGQDYVLLGSASGTGPSSYAGLDIPLTQDRFFQFMTSPAQRPYFQGNRGRLDGNGRASALLQLAPGAASSLTGRSLWFAALSYSPPANGRLSSAARRIDILP